MAVIRGGAPSPKHDIRLDDAVVSSPVGGMGGVIHYEFGKTIQNQKFERTGALNAPPTMLPTALNEIEARYERVGGRDASIKDCIPQSFKDPRRPIRCRLDAQRVGEVLIVAL
jgi:hypothetical protein